MWVWTADHGLVLVQAAAVLLATGGCGGLYAATTNQDHATGDGVALAYAAGAAVRDVEFVQFHPTGLAITGTWRLLLTEALRGAGATLLDREGRRFMVDLHPDAELAPRHVVSKGILAQPGGAFLDARDLGEERLAEEFPTVLAGAREYGFDLATEPVPVTPAAHYMVGGVRTDLEGRTSLAGLYAAGEVASSGVHGANRLAGNSLAEAMVFARRAAGAIARDGAGDGDADPGRAPVLREVDGRLDLPPVRDRLRNVMWEGAGPLRDAPRLLRCLEALDGIAAELGPPARDAEHLELSAAVSTSRLIARSALLRTETRGGHVREDHPGKDPGWADVHLERVRPPGA